MGQIVKFKDLTPTRMESGNYIGSSVKRVDDFNEEFDKHLSRKYCLSEQIRKDTYEQLCGWFR
jgi:hypothetical protein